MANAVASSSRDRPAKNRSSIQSLHKNEPNEGGVVITTSIQRTRRSTPRNDTIKMINQYEFKLRVGKGQHGEVYLALDTTQDNKKVAVKSVRRKNKSDKMSKLRKINAIPRTPHTQLVDQLGSTEHKIRKEIAIMKKLNHPHVVRLLEVIDDRITDKIYMVMEYLGGGEIKWRSEQGDPLLRVDQTRRICRDVILGLEYLHYQGIIHRDIKPANLLWTQDRRTVKISDFGVSTFSYAQRLAAAGKGDEDIEPILMDESDLSKTAGTPMFLAPEIVADVSAINESTTTVHEQGQPSDQDTSTAPVRRKLPITKSIDIWAFGVTLYGLLFGILPFQAKTEYEIYHVIRNQDFDIPATMGLDQELTAGRHPKLKRSAEKHTDTEGSLLVDLLERLLEKDARKRINLEEVKRHPWILYDLEMPDEWLRSTRLPKYLQLEATHDETSSAMSAVRFRWLPRIGRLLSTLRSVKPQRSFRRPQQPRDPGEEKGPVGVNSEPHIAHLARQHVAPEQPPLAEQQRQNSVRVKGKRRQGEELSRNKSTNDIATKPTKAFEPWSMWNTGATPGAGPSKSKSTETGLKVPIHPVRLTSPLPSPVGSSQVNTPISEYAPGHSPDSERPRSMVIQWMRKLGGSHRQLSYASYNSPLIEAGTSLANGRPHPIPATSPPSRDSADALGGISSRQSSLSMSGKFSQAMRAASWTAPEFAIARPSEDMTSLYSADKQEQLDYDTLFCGAGGVANSPVPSVPNSALLGTVSSGQSIGPPAVSAAQAILSRADAGADLPEPSQHDPAHPRHRSSQARLRTTSPLAQVSYNQQELGRRRVIRSDGGSDSETDSAISYDSADSSIFPAARMRRPVRSMLVNEDVDVELSEIEGGSFDLQPSTSQMYQDEDEESEDDEEVHLEVRTRRTSAGGADMSPPRRSLSAHRPQDRKQRQMICT